MPPVKKKPLDKNVVLRRDLEEFGCMPLGRIPRILWFIFLFSLNDSSNEFMS